MFSITWEAGPPTGYDLLEEVQSFRAKISMPGVAVRPSQQNRQNNLLQLHGGERMTRPAVSQHPGKKWFFFQTLVRTNVFIYIFCAIFTCLAVSWILFCICSGEYTPDSLPLPPTCITLPKRQYNLINTELWISLSSLKMHRHVKDEQLKITQYAKRKEKKTNLNIK